MQEPRASSQRAFQTELQHEQISRRVLGIDSGPSAIEVARGFVEGNPGILEIHERANAAPENIIRALADELEENFGPAPLRVPLRELVFTGNAAE